jgi:hypothetical protein
VDLFGGECVCLVFARTSTNVTVNACGRARWERQSPSFVQALLNGAIYHLMSIPMFLSLLWISTVTVMKTVYYRDSSVFACSAVQKGCMIEI